MKDWPAIKPNENSLLLPVENKKNITDLWQFDCHTSCEKAKQCNRYSGKVNRQTIPVIHMTTRESCWITENHLTTRYSFSECYISYSIFFVENKPTNMCGISIHASKGTAFSSFRKYKEKYNIVDIT